MVNVLMVDDDQSLTETLRLGLARRGYTVTCCGNAAGALNALKEQDFDVVVTDLNMKGGSGLDLCTSIAEAHRDVPVIVLTAFGNYETAVAAIRAGAYDFISKPVQLDVLGISIARAAQHRALHQEVTRLRSQRNARAPNSEFIGASPALDKVRDLIDRVADSEASVLVTGESGTGKEVVARALHRQSRRGDKPFIPINCAAMPEALLESELFGHARGAFTDARQAHSGLLVEAHGGTVFLDEIGDMPLGIQPKLLRALQERTIRPLGATAELPIDVRFIAATNLDIESAVEEKRFREDLFFRLNVIRLELPSLRERPADILPLAQHFMQRFAEAAGKQVTAISPAVAERLLSYSWPGNVRELQNCMERGVALARFSELGIDDLSERVRFHKSTDVVVAGNDPSELLRMEEVERRYILHVLEAVAGNKTAAARILGIERKTLYRKLEHFEKHE
ncbi:MAG TPA: sigma-54 dependent transcriptional regulator [Polyangiaceae bacterium]|nr:sigma-54 dependent transcriptional regulator [Polyangiaceae bacterium]